MSLNEVFDLMKHISLQRPAGFMGVGVLIYRDFTGLPVAPLGNSTLSKPHLPVNGIAAIANVLATISDRASLWHDGFHLIESGSIALTHISQFLAPPVTSEALIRSADNPRGARQMAAMLASELSCVEFSALMNSHGEVQVFQRGKLVTMQHG